jgi:hypothetical protein
LGRGSFPLENYNFNLENNLFVWKIWLAKTNWGAHDPDPTIEMNITGTKLK